MKINLSISIPTFNNSNMLNNWFIQHEFIIKKYKIPIFISNNNSTDDTASVIKGWQKKLKNIYHYPTKSTLKAEANFERAINLPQNGWVWLVGDSYLIDHYSIEKVIFTLKSKTNYGFCIININNRIKKLSNEDFDYNVALEDIAGAVSCISCNLYNLDFFGSIEFSNKNTSHFPHVNFFYLNILNGVNFVWMNDASIRMVKTKERRLNWSNTSKVWYIAIDNWYHTIENLKGYSIKSKLKAWTSFGRVSALFSVRGLFWLRAQGLLTNSIFKNKKFFFKRVLGKHYFLMRLIALIPIFPLKLITRIIGYKT